MSRSDSNEPQAGETLPLIEESLELGRRKVDLGGYRFIKPVARRNGDVHSASHTAEDGSRGIPRLSIVVLPFTNLSSDPGQEYVADAITDDLTTDLSWLPGMFVISRNTAFTFRGRPVDTRDIGRDLGVRYVLEGSVRPLGNQVRINAQLIDAVTGSHLWAERFDLDVADVSALQDEVTRRIAIALNLALVAAEAARPTGHPNAVDYVLRSRPHDEGTILCKPGTGDFVV